MEPNKIAQLGEDILRGPIKEVSDVRSSEVQALIADLMQTVTEAKGVGIAANQVRSNLRVCVIASHPNERYPYAPLVEPFALINPILLSHSNDIEKDWEGCLSVPGIRGMVPRWKTVTIEFMNAGGTKEQRTLEGFLARIFQHEIDHLDGLVYLDRVESNKDLYSHQEFEKRIASRKAGN
jgi:peptide deformylase